MSHSTNNFCDKMIDYAKDNPIKFVSLGSFISLGAIPLLAFLGYVATAIVVSLIGAIVVDLFLISVAAVGLGLVFCCVTCLSLCATSVFGAFYLSFKALRKTADVGFRLNKKSTWPTAADPKDS